MLLLCSDCLYVYPVVLRMMQFNLLPLVLAAGNPTHIYTNQILCIEYKMNDCNKVTVMLL